MAQNITIDRKSLFGAVRRLLGRPLVQAEVGRLDTAIDRVLANPGPHPLGHLSQQYESGGRGPGTVSGGRGDPGGVSYGLYQLASRTGTVTAFLACEGADWARDLNNQPGTAPFSAAWKAIAAREGERFAEAQHAFIARSHYRPAVAAVLAATGLDLDQRPDPVRDAVWSTAVQHGRAGRLLAQAVASTDASTARADPAYDRMLIAAIYSARAGYVRGLAAHSGPAVRRTLITVAERRYPEEMVAALASLASLG